MNPQNVLAGGGMFRTSWLKCSFRVYQPINLWMNILKHALLNISLGRHDQKLLKLFGFVRAAEGVLIRFRVLHKPYMSFTLAALASQMLVDSGKEGMAKDMETALPLPRGSIPH